MEDLLETAVAAQGGLGRWHQVKSITVDASTRAQTHWPQRFGERIGDPHLLTGMSSTRRVCQHTTNQ